MFWEGFMLFGVFGVIFWGWGVGGRGCILLLFVCFKIFIFCFIVGVENEVLVVGFLFILFISWVGWEFNRG